MNPLDALADFIIGKIKEGLYARWLKFLFELVFSAIVSFLFACGSALVPPVRATPAVAIGIGMIAAAISLTALFRRERGGLTKGMIVVLPTTEAQQEIDASLQTIEKPEK